MTIPTTNALKSTFGIALDGQTLQLSFRYNFFEPGWYMDLEGISLDILFRGIALVGGVNMLRGLAIPELGEMWVWDNDNKFEDPTKDGFGSRFELVYIPKVFL
jgi:hypothetical protein